MTETAFRDLIATVTATIAGRPLDAALAGDLNARFGPGTPTYEAIRRACAQAIEQGWMCNREAGGIRYGRVAKADDALHRFSIDVVDMDDVVGPHHVHPDGEIDLVMPLSADARFDGHPAGWTVYPPGSAHHPTVSGGRALVLYLLPEGRIEFTRTQAKTAEAKR
jgi:hypothetical protein